MNSRLARPLCMVLLFLVCGAASAQRYTAEQMAREPWIRGPQVSSAHLSPNGKLVAGLAQRGLSSLVVVSDTSGGNVRILARREPDSRYRFGQLPMAVHWVTDELLAVDYNTRESVSMDLSGKVVASLGQAYIRPSSADGAAAEDVLVYLDLDDGEIATVNARTGKRTPFRVDLPGKLQHWAFDDKGVLRAVTMLESGRWRGDYKRSNWYRDTADSPWGCWNPGR